MPHYGPAACSCNLRTHPSARKDTGSARPGPSVMYLLFISPRPACSYFSDEPAGQPGPLIIGMPLTRADASPSVRSPHAARKARCHIHSRPISRKCSIGISASRKRERLDLPIRGRAAFQRRGRASQPSNSRVATRPRPLSAHDLAVGPTPTSLSAHELAPLLHRAPCLTWIWRCEKTRRNRFVPALLIPSPPPACTESSRATPRPPIRKNTSRPRTRIG